MTYLFAHASRGGGLVGQHVVLVGVSLAIALLIAVPLGVLATRNARAGGVILAVTGTIYTIPSLALLARPAPPAAGSRPNERWSMDFVHDYLEDGRSLRTLNIVDAYTRECLAIEVDTSLPSARVVGALDRLVWRYGLPQTLRTDNGPEFISMNLDVWATRHGVKLDFIQPGKPVQNAHVESFNGHFRDECLAQQRFPTVTRARAEIEAWRIDYNCQRPHSSLDYQTPKAFGDEARRNLPPSAGAAAAMVEGELATGTRIRLHKEVEMRTEVN